MQENTERVLKEQKRLERQREVEQKRRSLAVCTGLDLVPSLAREPHRRENQDELEKLLEKNLSYTWSRRSLRSSDTRRYSHQIQNDTHLHNLVLKNFPELGSSPTSTGCLSNGSSDQDTTAELGVSSPDTDGTCSPTEQESSVGRGGLCEYDQATNRSTIVAQDSSSSCHSQHGQDFTVKQHGPDRVSYILQRHQSAGLKIESENTRGHIVLNHQTSCTISATLPTEMASKFKSQTATRGQMVMAKPLATEGKSNGANFKSVHHSAHAGGIHSHTESKADLSRYARSESQMRSISDAPESAKIHQHQVGEMTRISNGAIPDTTLKMHNNTAPTTPVKENWLPSSLPDFINSQPEGFADLPSPEPEIERSYSRVGETVECHTLVKGLRSYDTLSPPTSPLPRPAPSLCSKWRKEREGDLRDGTTPGSPTSKEEARSVKTRARSGIGGKRGLVSHAASNSTRILRVHSKNEPSNGIQTTENSPSRLASPRSTAMRSSVVTQSTAFHSEVKCSNSTQERTVNESQTAGKSTPNRRTSERSLPEKSSGSTQQAFVRGSLFRVSKRLAPNSEAQVTAQPHNAHSPSSATAKTIRTTVISAVRNKAAKTTSASTSPASSKSTAVSRIPGPKMPRATAAQPLWR